MVVNMKNPHAFPLHPEYYDEDCLGMTLRDYFAAKAMQALIDKEAFFDDVAESAYKVADHMLRAREA
jgi:hypothetical protein